VTLPPALERRWLAALSPARQTQLLGWPDARARHRSLLGSRLLLYGLRAWGFAPQSLQSLHHPPQGKPTLDLPVDFSLSHCEGRVLCALSAIGAIGVDVESTTESMRAVDFRRYLSEAERYWAGDDPQRFYSLWTRKEAVVKATGSGLARLHEVQTTEDCRARFDKRLWHTPAVSVGSQHVAHLAVLHPLTTLPLEQPRLEDLRQND